MCQNLSPIRLLVYKLQLSEATVANFQNNGKILILCVNKAWLSDGKILFKQSNGLISVIWTLLSQKQRLRGGMLTLNAVIQTQMMLNTQVAQISLLFLKTQKNLHMWQWMKHGSTTSLRSQTGSQLNGQQQVKAVQSNQRRKHEKERFWPPYFGMHKVFCASITLRKEEPSIVIIV